MTSGLFRWVPLLLFSFSAAAVERAPAKTEYVFDPAVIGEIAQHVSALPVEQAIEQAHAELRERYGEKVAPIKRWIFNDAGNVLLQITILYCSAHEYLIFFNTPIGATGFSGRYKKVEFYDYIITGRMLTYRTGQFSAKETHPGEFGYMSGGDELGFRVDDGTTAIEYGRGDILSAFKFGIIAPARFFTLDWKSAGEQIGDCAKIAIHEIFHKR